MKRLFVISVFLTVCACAADWPAWVLDPPTELGMAAGDCVPWSGSISLDRQQVAAHARLALAQQISVQIKGMDKTYAARVDNGQSPKLSTSFESTSQQTVDAALTGSRLSKVEVVDTPTGKFLCGLVTLAQDADKRIVRTVMQSAGVPPEGEVEELLLAKFRSRSSARPAP